MGIPAAGEPGEPIGFIQSEADRVEQRLYQVEASAAAVEQILALGLNSDEAGRLLREARARLSEPRELTLRLDGRRRELAEAKLDLVVLLEQQRAAEVSQWMRLQEDVKRQEAEVTRLEVLLDLEERLAKASTDLAERLDGALLFMGSAAPVDGEWLQQVVVGVRGLVVPDHWGQAGLAVGRRFLRSPLSSALVVLAVVLLLVGRGWMARREATLAGLTKRLATDTFLVSLRALLWTTMRSLAGPSVFLGLGFLLWGANEAFPRAFARGFLAAGLVWLLFGFFRRVCVDGGLASVYFGWNEHARRVLAANLAWLIPVEVPLAFVGAVARSVPEAGYFDGLGRLAFMVGTLAFAVFMARVFRPSGGVFAELLNRQGWAWRVRWLWYVLLVGVPVGLTAAAANGYFVTAIQVQDRFVISVVIVLVGVIAYSLLVRWLLVARRRALLRQARQRLAEHRETRDQLDSAAEPASGEAAPELEETPLDVDEASKQTRTLLRIGVVVSVAGLLWAVWAQLLPALAVLESVPVSNATLADDGSVIVPAVTLWSLLMAGLVGVITVIAARNLPAVLELVVLERFPLDAGTRYAVVVLLRYVVIALGIVWLSQLMKIDWGKAQWIVAALGVGLGFGLQEIVANFVSGLIILFERPVRVGDVVTVGDVSGTVSRVQIRATTITDFENKETIVPNKSFITDRVINWTLSNSTTRLLMGVGIAYGSDVAKAHAVITEAVRSVPTVLDTPEPTVFFTGFGDSSLDFEIRAFVGQNPHRLPTLHALHTAIDAALREAEIEIPFPQRDLHLRSSAIDGSAPTGIDVGTAADTK